jgi:glutaredoxin
MFLIYSRDNCSYCLKATGLISGLCNGSKPYVEFKNPPPDVVAKLKESTGHKTYPFIFCGDTFLGGYNEMKKDILTVILVMKHEYDFDVEVDF